MCSFHLIILPKLTSLLEDNQIPFEVELWNQGCTDKPSIVCDILWRYSDFSVFDVMAFEKQFYSEISLNDGQWQNQHPEEVQAIIDKYGPVKSQPSQELRDKYNPNLN